MSVAIPHPMPQVFDKASYEYKDYTPTFPKVDYAPHKPFDIQDRALRADPEKKAFLSACTSVKHLVPSIGTEIHGIDLSQLTEQQMDEMALLGAERGVLVFRDQKASIAELLRIAEHYGPIHVHSTTGVPTDASLKGVHVVFNDGTTNAQKRMKWYHSGRAMGWHSDQSYEANTMGFTALKIVTSPSAGGDTMWSTSQGVLSTFSPGYVKYLEGLYALHSAAHQKQRSIDEETYIRRPQTDCIHPVVRVHPVTGIKGLYINPSYTKSIVNVPKHESDAVMKTIFEAIEKSLDMQVRVKWEKDTVVWWDNRMTWHSGIGDYFPESRHGLRATPMAEVPMSVEEYEKKTGEKAKDWFDERMKSFGIDDWEESREAYLAKKLSTKIKTIEGDGFKGLEARK